ncbi:hypothetical protein, partial [Actinoplanes utahensis]|uniref:hypothetical protein n=1 Tax=Actinoplanes utahensis TaxID=1869 RepID=UPI00194FBD06
MSLVGFGPVTVGLDAFGTVAFGLVGFSLVAFGLVAFSLAQAGRPSRAVSGSVSGSRCRVRFRRAVSGSFVSAAAGRSF